MADTSPGENKMRATTLKNWLGIAAVGTLFVSARMASAATITFIGADVDLGSGWRTASVPKTDPAHTNVLGQGGWYVTGTSITGVPGDVNHVTPSYFSSMDMTAPEYGGNGSYASIDDPNTTPGATPSAVLSGTKNPFPGTNNYGQDLSFTVNSSVPAVFQVAVMVDNLDNAAYNSNGMEVVGPAAIGTTYGAVNFNATPTLYDRVPDWLYFTISGAKNGDTFTVDGLGGPNGCACAGAFAFDTVSSTPEPATLGLMGVFAAGFLARRRRA